MYFIKLTKFTIKPFIVFFLNHYMKMKEVFFPKKCSPVIIFTKKDHTKKWCNASANNRSIYIIKAKTEKKSI